MIIFNIIVSLHVHNACNSSLKALLNSFTLSYVIARVHFSQCLYNEEAYKGTRVARACGVLMVKIPNKCILSIFVHNPFYRQTAHYFHIPISWLSS